MHWRQRRTGGRSAGRPAQERVEERRRRRALAVSRTVRELLVTGAHVTHERVSGGTGLPVGYLRWAYPLRADLLAAVGGEPSPGTGAPQSSHPSEDPLRIL
ncbi:hypothetical protein [Cellulomonas dongxiuzhuiae]|uniref:hypothetical protein n=1 Tax=Cellulomonas dongxiuzhuiae TaxID=2819979 RepID=UPI001AAF0804|nr:hypothetical protein [Cellulomonas dongxiuzhuiae]MBO3089614.1 hypothetical protein [Cellulomonas dongxiuzhuiae]